MLLGTLAFAHSPVTPTCGRLTGDFKLSIDLNVSLAPHFMTAGGVSTGVRLQCWIKLDKMDGWMDGWMI